MVCGTILGIWSVSKEMQFFVERDNFIFNFLEDGLLLSSFALGLVTRSLLVVTDVHVELGHLVSVLTGRWHFD